MSQDVKQIKVLIASPSDVEEECKAITDVIHSWNATNSDARAITLQPVNWKTHSAPEMGAPAQAILNKKVVRKCDIIIAVFQDRLGTRTATAESGTAEEIREFLQEEKPALVYFSAEPSVYEKVNRREKNRLLKFKDWCRQNGLVADYSSIPDLTLQVRQHIDLHVNDMQMRAVERLPEIQEVRPNDARVQKLEQELAELQNRLPRLGLILAELEELRGQTSEGLEAPKSSLLSNEQISIAVYRQHQDFVGIMADAQGHGRNRNEMQQFSNQFKEHLESLACALRMQRSYEFGPRYKFNFVLENKGTSLASDVVVTLEFPEETFAVDKDDLYDDYFGVPQLPTAPEPSWVQNRSDFIGLGRVGVPTEPPSTARGPLYDPEGDRSVVDYVNPKLYPQTSWDMPPVVVYLPPTSSETLTVKYTILADQLSGPVRGTLNVPITGSPGETNNTEPSVEMNIDQHIREILNDLDGQANSIRNAIGKPGYLTQSQYFKLIEALTNVLKVSDELHEYPAVMRTVIDFSQAGKEVVSERARTDYFTSRTPEEEQKRIKEFLHQYEIIMGCLQHLKGQPT